MLNSLIYSAACGLLSVALLQSVAAQPDTQSAEPQPAAGLGDQLVDEYFILQTARQTEQTLAGIDSLDQWQQRRPQYRQQLFEMLGLEPLPARTPLAAEVTGKTERAGIIVENLHFQSRPGLYVTANLYRPAEQSGPLPAILYVCGHGRVKVDGVSYGNKTHYQHHGTWFARNGYVCLTIDTIQLGEIEGIHHGTYREKMWWWNNRGYTPAGVEAWNCIRSIDYLQSREEVDGERIGVTGRSGGGAYSWWVAALDERVKVAVPVAGITSLHNHVVDGCVEGHCDCMYMVNTYRWDYPLVAALVAPRPLLISNTDKDRIFPLDGVIDVHSKVRRIYELYDAGDRLGLQITEGPHQDTQELRVHAFRWFNRWLKDDDSLIEETATKRFEPAELKVFEKLPEDQIVTTIHQTFVPAVSADPLPATDQQLAEQSQEWIRSLREKTFGGWPSDDEQVSLDVSTVGELDNRGLRIKAVEFASQPPYRLPLFVAQTVDADHDHKSAPVTVHVLDQSGWDARGAALSSAIDPSRALNQADQVDGWEVISDDLSASPTGRVVYVIPRGVGPTEWSRDERERTQIRRRFMQLGQTAAGMQIWDVRRALQTLDHLPASSNRHRNLFGSGEAAVWALYASLWEPRISGLSLEDLPTSNRQAPDLLNVSRFVEIPQLLLTASSRVDSVRLRVPADSVSSAWIAIQNSGLSAADRIEVESR